MNDADRNEQNRSNPPRSSQQQRNGACPECAGQVVATGGNEHVCQDCDLVISDTPIDHGPEWRAYTADQHQAKARTGPGKTSTRHDNGLGTEIGTPNTDSPSVTRIRSLNNQLRGGKTQREALLLTEIKRYVSAFDFSNTITERACKIGSDAHNANLAVGRSIDAVAVAASIAAFREARLPIKLEDFSRYTNESLRLCSLVLQDIYRHTDAERAIITPKEHVTQIGSSLGLPDTVIRKARRLCNTIETEEPQLGSHPTSIASAAIYIMSRGLKSPPTQKEIADAADISTTAIRDTRKKLPAALIKSDD